MFFLVHQTRTTSISIYLFVGKMLVHEHSSFFIKSILAYPREQQLCSVWTSKTDWLSKAAIFNHSYAYESLNLLATNLFFNSTICNSGNTNRGLVLYAFIQCSVVGVKNILILPFSYLDHWTLLQLLVHTFPTPPIFSLMWFRNYTLKIPKY